MVTATEIVSRTVFSTRPIYTADAFFRFRSASLHQNDRLPRLGDRGLTP